MSSLHTVRSLSEAGKVRMQTPKIGPVTRKAWQVLELATASYIINVQSYAGMSVNSKWAGTVADRPAEKKYPHDIRSVMS